MRALRTIALVITVLLVVIACSAPAQLILLSNDGEFIDYSGTATLSGTYFLDLSNLEIQDLVCFHPDEPSQKLLPTRPDLNHPHWMCFSNSAEARKLFGLTSPRRTDSDCYKGYAKLTVRNYRRYIAESEGVSLSEIAAVHQHSAGSAVPCDVLNSL